MWISKVFTEIKAKILIPWHRNSVNEPSMLLPKYVSKDYWKTIFPQEI